MVGVNTYEIPVDGWLAIAYIYITPGRCATVARNGRLTMRTGHILQTHENGLIAVEQLPCNGWVMTYNPDDGRFYVHAPDDNLTIMKTFGGVKGLNNARHWAKTHNIEG